MSENDRHCDTLVAKEQKDNWVESVMNVAHTCKKLFTKHTCRLCQVYVDQQVEYERRQEVEGEHIQTFDANTAPSLEIEIYRQFLFDEGSVVETVSGREKADDGKSHDDTQSTVTQRTN